MSQMRRVAGALELAPQEHALEIAARGLAILAMQSALAAGVLREMSEILGGRVRTGIVAEGGRSRAYAEGVELGAFATFDAALEALCRRLAGGR